MTSKPAIPVLKTGLPPGKQIEHDKCGNVDARGKPANKIVIALARELAGFIWAVGQVPELLDPRPIATPVSPRRRKKKGEDQGHTTPAQQQQG